MPFAVYVLGLAVFAQGTSEFMLSGLISGIATDLNVSLAAAGLLTSAFAVGMVVGAPLMALFARTWPRRRALLLFLAVFVAVHVIGALTPSYGVLLATRFAGAVANAGFWAVALTTAVSLVPAQLKARAAAVVVGGVTVACVVGVPAGAVLGERWGWRSAFWAVALVCVPAVLALVRNVPAGRPDAETAPVPVPVPVRTELGVLSRSRLRLTLLTMALVQGATFCTFSYLEPLLTRETGLSAGWVPAALALFGVGSFIGVTVAGRFADRRPTALIASGMVALALGWSALALTAGSPPAALALILVQGMFAFGTGTALIARVLDEAPRSPEPRGGVLHDCLQPGRHAGPLGGRPGPGRRIRLPGAGLGERCADGAHPDHGRGTAGADPGDGVSTR
ncbi:Cmx/CmrA family chloramphenicol efflux MFS transporter [Streptomyces sp. NBC_00932]|uniref:Cmx/CmrA family chloramphenicol efflux MFS transporter n=1 Tax=Streptomyces sp. NBC_00932 TaxID=2903690 RepID=UPI00386FC709|nr:MFS transporter [Streptomyces sp. NBC_00932]